MLLPLFKYTVNSRFLPERWKLCSFSTTSAILLLKNCTEVPQQNSRNQNTSCPCLMSSSPIRLSSKGRFKPKMRSVSLSSRFLANVKYACGEKWDKYLVDSWPVTARNTDEQKLQPPSSKKTIVAILLIIQFMYLLTKGKGLSLI